MRLVSSLAGFAIGLLSVTGLNAQDYPNKPVRIIAAYTPGGGTDLLARIVAKKLGEVWGQQVVVENRPGAGGNIGTDAVAKAPPDGYTLLIAPSTHAIVPNLYAKLPFDTLKDFTFLTLVAAGPNILVVHPSVPASNV
ncbi:MAG TPA: tripartite tricarboxylate transporter substrate-binding protein, partial [Burkholderiales bacterium]|nr:tripartite tricarboxylate transporter substrate-binding protein [Burkholderiales bacterium]